MFMFRSIDDRKIDVSQTSDNDTSISEQESLNSNEDRMNDHNQNEEFSILMSPLLAKNLDDLLGSVKKTEVNIIERLDNLSNKIEEYHFDINNSTRRKDYLCIQNKILMENNLFLNQKLHELYSDILTDNNISIIKIKNKITSILRQKVSFDNDTYMTGI